MFKSLFKNILYSLFHSANLNTFASVSHQNLFLPFYHIISNYPSAHIKELYSPRNTNTFKQDLDFLTNCFTSISINELHQQIKQQVPFSKPVFHLTFDDGLKEMLTVVAPILKERGIPATFFVNSAFIDNKDLFYRYKVSLLIHYLKTYTFSPATLKEIFRIFPSKGIHSSDVRTCLLAVTYKNKDLLDYIAPLLGLDFSDYLKQQQPYLTTEDILQLKQMGFTIGAHSIDHPHYKHLTLEEQLHQTKESLTFIKTKFDLPYSYFSFPFSDEKVSKAFFGQIFSADESIVDLSFGISGLKKDSFPYHLHRFPMEGTQLSAERLIKGEYLYYLAKSLINKNTIVRK